MTRLPDSDDTSSKDNTETSSSKSLNKKKYVQQSGPKDDPLDMNECPVCRVAYGEIISLKLELRALKFELRSIKLELDKVFEELNQFASAYEMKNEGKAKDVKNTSKILDFEFCKLYGEVSKYVDTFSPFGNFADVWFNGKIDTSTGKVIYSSYGRAIQHQKRPAIESMDDEGDTVE